MFEVKALTNEQFLDLTGYGIHPEVRVDKGHAGPGHGGLMWEHEYVKVDLVLNTLGTEPTADEANYGKHGRLSIRLSRYDAARLLEALETQIDGQPDETTALERVRALCDMRQEQGVDAVRIDDVRAMFDDDVEPCAEFGSHRRGEHARTAREEGMEPADG